MKRMNSERRIFAFGIELSCWKKKKPVALSPSQRVSWRSPAYVVTEATDVKLLCFSSISLSFLSWGWQTSELGMGKVSSSGLALV